MTSQSVVAILFDLDGTMVHHGTDDDGNFLPINGLISFLDMVDASNISKAVVTNAPRTKALKTLDALNLTHRFEDKVVIGGECAKPKPAPEPYLEALKVTGGTPERTVVFEDSASGITSAKAAGIFSIGIISARNEEDLLKAGADVCIRDYRDPNLWCIVTQQLKLDE